MNRLENLPYDLILLIYERLHKKYMYDLAEELEEFVEEWEWRKENNLADDFDEDYDPSTDYESSSEYSFVESD